MMSSIRSDAVRHTHTHTHGKREKEREREIERCATGAVDVSIQLST